MNYLDISNELNSLANIEKANLLQRFFKTGKGEYGEGDIFLGITVPKTRLIAKKYLDLDLNDIKKLLISKIHEKRLCALLILVLKYSKANYGMKKKIYIFYINNIKQVNNWDLVDLSAPRIVGDYLLNKSKSVLYKFALSNNIWIRRISIISTMYFVKYKKYSDTLKISRILINDKHDLIHKAVGWMLREVGKKSKKDEEIFLNRYYKIMPRMMLRYAIEKFPEAQRQRYLKK